MHILHQTAKLTEVLSACKKRLRTHHVQPSVEENILVRGNNVEYFELFNDFLLGWLCLFVYLPIRWSPLGDRYTASHLWCNSNTRPPLRELTATGHPLPVIFNQAMPSGHVHHLCHFPAHCLSPLLAITLLSRDPSLSPQTSLDLTPPLTLSPPL